MTQRCRSVSPRSVSPAGRCYSQWFWKVIGGSDLMRKYGPEVMRKIYNGRQWRDRVENVRSAAFYLHFRSADRCIFQTFQNHCYSDMWLVRRGSRVIGTTSMWRHAIPEQCTNAARMPLRRQPQCNISRNRTITVHSRFTVCLYTADSLIPWIRLWLPNIHKGHNHGVALIWCHRHVFLSSEVIYYSPHLCALYNRWSNLEFNWYTIQHKGSITSQTFTVGQRTCVS